MHISFCTAGLWVMQTHGRKRVGIIRRVFPSRDIEVEFKTRIGQPFCEVLKPRSFRIATSEEIKEELDSAIS